MGQIDVLGPVSDVSAGGWTPVGDSTIWEALADASDATYATWSAGATVAVVGLTPHSPPAGMRRHLARVLSRGEDGSAALALRLPDATLTAPVAATYPSSPGEINGAWGTGLPPTGAVDFTGYLLAQSAGVKITQMRVEIDNREAPTFTLGLLDGSGSPNTTITDTAAPTAVFGAQDLDGLPARAWRAWVTQGAATVWDTGEVSGPVSDVEIGPLVNGSYTLHAQIWSTVGADGAFPSAVQTLAFDIDFLSVTTPLELDVQQRPNTPFFDIYATLTVLPGTFDPGSLRIQVERIDCNGTVRIVDEYVPEPEGSV